MRRTPTGKTARSRGLGSPTMNGEAAVSAGPDEVDGARAQAAGGGTAPGGASALPGVMPAAWTAEVITGAVARPGSNRKVPIANPGSATVSIVQRRHRPGRPSGGRLPALM